MKLEMKKKKGKYVFSRDGVYFALDATGLILMKQLIEEILKMENARNEIEGCK